MWYDAMQVSIQVVQIILISIVMVWAFVLFTYKIDLTLSMAVCALVGPSYDFLKPLEGEDKENKSVENSSSSLPK